MGVEDAHYFAWSSVMFGSRVRVEGIAVVGGMGILPEWLSRSFAFAVFRRDIVVLLASVGQAAVTRMKASTLYECVVVDQSLSQCIVLRFMLRRFRECQGIPST